MKKKLGKNEMTKAEIFMLDQLLTKATYTVEDGIVLNWFDEIVEASNVLTEDEKLRLTLGSDYVEEK